MQRGRACVKVIDCMSGMKYFDVSLSAMRLVATVVKTRKLTTAAELLHLSQSGASHALRVLESQLGVALFVRHREGLQLSEAGQRLLPFIEAVIDNLEAMRAELGELSTLRTGSLRVAAVPSLLSTILPPILREYASCFPGIEISIFEGTDDEVRDWVHAGVAHIGFAALPIQGVATEEILRDEWLALVPQRKFPGKSEITLSELSRHKFLMSGGGCETHIQRLFRSGSLSTPEHLMVKQLSTIQAMVAQGLGVSLVPSLSIRNLNGSRALPLKPRQFRTIGMLRSSASVAGPAVEAWASLVRTRLKGSPPARPARKITPRKRSR